METIRGHKNCNIDSGVRHLRKMEAFVYNLQVGQINEVHSICRRVCSYSYRHF